MLGLDSLLQCMHGTQLEKWSADLPQLLNQLAANRHGKYDLWHRTIMQLPKVSQVQADFQAADLNIQFNEAVDADKLELLLQVFHPWRKGPYRIGDVYIDTEWHSDWKWARIRDHIAPLKNRVVLDVGCGNGYHCWRMYGEGARLVIGIDPSWLFLAQFQVIKHFVGRAPVFLLPMGVESLPAELEAFDTVFSMGVFYHRRSPIDHLLQLKEQLRKGGELVLETLVIEGREGEVLVPDDRYAKMRNVWFLPTPATLAQWMKRCGFSDIRLLDINRTSLEEQRATHWMRNESLVDFLDPGDSTKTIEGYPAPCRATFAAVK